MQKTVAQLIAELEKIEDKDREVRFWVQSFDSEYPYGASPVESFVEIDNKMGTADINIKLDGRRFIQNDWN